MTYKALMTEVLALSLEEKLLLRDWLRERIPIEAAEQEWQRQQACPHTKAKEMGPPEKRYWWCPDCHLTQDKSLTRSAGQ